VLYEAVRGKAEPGIRVSSRLSRGYTGKARK
jgi:hypothetical protein